MTEQAKQAPDNKNRKLGMRLLIAAVLMFGFGFLMVPFYNVFCKVAGINGKTGDVVSYASVSSTPIDKERTITMQFVTTNNENLPYKFYPHVASMKFHPGELVHTTFYAENTTGRAMTVQAIPSVSPGQAARYLKKTECFCFRQQHFEPYQGRDMPLVFQIDPHLPKDINTLTLSYTLFDAGKFVKNNQG